MLCTSCKYCLFERYITLLLSIVKMRRTWLSNWSTSFLSFARLLTLLVRLIDKRESFNNVGISSIVSMLHVLTYVYVCAYIFAITLIVITPVDKCALARTFFIFFFFAFSCFLIKKPLFYCLRLSSSNSSYCSSYDLVYEERKESKRKKKEEMNKPWSNRQCLPVYVERSGYVQRVIASRYSHLSFLFLFNIMQVTFPLLMVKLSHTYDAPLPIHPVALTNGSSISVFLRDHNNQSGLF